MRAHKTTLLTMGIALAGLGSESTLGQYELDANLSSQGSRFNSPIPPPNYQGRNLLVTGNVAGGRGFRGTVGYPAAFDFRGETGSDDLFGERANAAFSAPIFIASRTSMEALRFGQFLNEVEYRKATRGSNLTSFADMPGVSNRVLAERLALDRVAISSTTSAIYAAAGDAQIVGLFRDEEGRHIMATASSLMGLQLSLAEQQGQFIGLNSFDMARTWQDVQAGRATGTVGARFEFSYRDLRPGSTRNEAPMDPSRLDTDLAAASRIELPVETSYLEIMDRIAERAETQLAEEAEGRPEMLANLDLQFAALRNQLAGMVLPADESTTEGDAAETTPGLPDLLRDPNTPSDELRLAAEAMEAMAEALRHGLKLDYFSGRDDSRFDELMTSAEESLRDGEYFWAERRFERSLRFRPGHPLATAGLGHAQIGAGLYLPAALTLRGLLTQHPEMIDTRYDAKLLPSHARLSRAAGRVRELLTPRDRDRELHGLLLAYIGHQLDDRDMAGEGLAALTDGPLKTLLEAVWLGE